MENVNSLHKVLQEESCLNYEKDVDVMESGNSHYKIIQDESCLNYEKVVDVMV